MTIFWKPTLSEAHYLSRKEARENKIQNNHKNGSRPKEFNKNIDTSISAPPRDKFLRNKPKVNSVWFVEPYDHINTVDINNESTYLVNAHEEHIR